VTEKSLIVTVYVDGVPLGDLEAIQEGLELLFESFEDKRIQLQIQDEKLVRFIPGQ